MVNIETHEIVDMIDSRRIQDVTDWLKTYPNITVVSRDGSIIYKKAISDALPQAMQVNDRFHIIKNLADSCKQFLKRYFQSKVIVEENKTLNKFTNDSTVVLADLARSNLLTLKDKYDGAMALIKSGKSKSYACKEFRLDIRVFKKLSAMTQSARDFRLTGAAKQKQNSALQIKQKKIETVKYLYKAGVTKTRIAKELGLDFKTVVKYISLENAQICALLGFKRQSIVDPYKDEIETAVKSGMTGKSIFDLIKSKGYNGTARTLRAFIAKWKLEHKDQLLSQASELKVTWVNRNLLLKACYKKLHEINGITKKIIQNIFKRYPKFKKIYILINSFKKLMKNQEHAKLEKWLEQPESLDIMELNSFAKGIRRDKAAVKNAIEYHYNNGLAEGFINKLKVIKRIMYGKCRFETLKNKSLLIQKYV